MPEQMTGGWLPRTKDELGWCIAGFVGGCLFALTFWLTWDLL